MIDDGAGRGAARQAHGRFMATLMVTTALCLGALPGVLPVQQAAAQAARTHDFSIPSQPLSAALRALAGQTGVQIAYETSVAAGTIAPAVSGTMSTEDALALILSGSGLRYSFSGANTVTILEAGSGTEIGNVATDGSTVLDTIMVTTAGGFAQQVVDAPASITVIPREDLENKPFRSLIDAVRHVEGVTMTGGDKGDITIRGMPASGTLILVDGRRQNSTRELNPKGGNAVEDDWMPPIGAVDRIEVVRGPMSVLYGSDALGGVVNTITRRPADHWQGSVRLSGSDARGAGGGDAVGGGVYLSGPLGDTLRIGLSATHLDRDPLELKENRRLSEIEGTELDAGHLLLSWAPLAGHTLDLEHRVADEERTRQQISSGTYYRDLYDIERTQSIATWKGNWGEVDSQLRVWESDFSVKSKRTNGVAPTRPQSMEERGVDGRVGFGIGSAQYLTVGFDARKEEMKNAGLVGGKDDATHKALYLQDEIGLSDSVMLTLGVRHDRHSIFGGETSPRAYLVWHLDERWTVRGGYGEGFRAPTLKQISPNYEGHEGPHSFYGNGDIKPETSRSVELGVAYAHGGVEWEATVFHNDVKDLITTRLLRITPPSGGLPIPRRHYLYDNVDEARIIGVETAAKWQLGRGFYLGGNAQWLDTKDKETGDELDGRSRILLNARAGWKQGPWDAVLRAEHIGRQYLDGERAPSYNLLHASAGYRINEHLGVSLGVDNLTDVRLAEKSEAFSYSETPRTLRVSLHGSF